MVHPDPMFVDVFGRKMPCLLLQAGEQLDLIMDRADAQALRDAFEIKETVWVDEHPCLISLLVEDGPPFTYVATDGVELDGMVRLTLVLEELQLDQ